MTRKSLLLQWILVALLAVGVAAAQDAGSAKKSSAGSVAKTSKAASPAGEKLDINSATKDQLTALAGIGDAYSQKIIDGRPYRTKRDLLTRKIIPQATYDQITDHIIAHQAAGAAAKKK